LAGTIIVAAGLNDKLNSEENQSIERHGRENILFKEVPIADRWNEVPRLKKTIVIIGVGNQPRAWACLEPLTGPAFRFV
jgi:hypothetical protein